MSQPPDDPYLPPQPGQDPPGPVPPAGPPSPYGQPGQPPSAYGRPAQPSPYGQPMPYSPGAAWGPLGGPYDGASVDQLLADPPEPVRRLRQVMVAGAVLAGLTGAYGLLSIDRLLTEAAPDLDQAAAESGMDPAALADLVSSVGAVVLVVVTLVTVGLWLLFARLFSRGQGRVVGTVLGAINAVSGLTALVGVALGADPVELLLQTLTLVAVDTGLVLLWRPQTTAWFQAVTAARQRASWG
jgi:hypothetical protein